MKLEVFVSLLLLISTLTGLVTESVKKLFEEHGQTPRPNTTAGLVALVLAVGIGIGYVLFTGQILTTQIIICIVALVFMSWLCAMVGYDKVMQTLAQIGVKKKAD